MFGRKNAVAEPAVLPAPVVRPVAVVPDLDEEFARLGQERYTALAEELEFESPAVWKVRLMGVLREKGKGIFEYGAVKRYLDKEMGPVGDSFPYWGQTWGWRPLRDLDSRDSGLDQTTRRGNGRKYDNGALELIGTYPFAVPLDVVELAAWIYRELPTSRFFVSDKVREQDWVHVGDPFLAVTTRGLRELIVVACWDEPGFKESAKRP